MSLSVTVTSRWLGAIPTRKGKPLPETAWSVAGRKRAWTVRWRRPDGSRPRKTFRKSAQAKAFRQELVAEYESTGPQALVRRPRVTLGEFRDEFLELRTGPRGQRLSIGTLTEYRNVLNRFTDFVGADVLLEQVAMSHATRYLADIRKPSKEGTTLSVSTLNKHKRNLVSAFNTAVVQLGYLKASPFTGLRQDKVADHAVRFVTPEEFQSILAACRSRAKKPLWWEAFVTSCYTAGLRANEATHLTWADVDFGENTLRVIAKPENEFLPAWQPKDHDSRTIPVPEATIDLFTQLHAEAAEGSEYVFLSPERLAWIRTKRDAETWGEGQAVRNNLDRDFKRFAKAACVENVSLHDLRRSAISHWARKLAAPIVMELAGHASIATTLRYYVSIRRADMAEARQVIEDAMVLDPNWTQNSDSDTIPSDAKT